MSAPAHAPVAPADPLAPHGRKVDGTPAAKRGPKPKTEQFERLDSVTRAAPRVQRQVTIAAPPVIAVDYDALSAMAANLWFNAPQIFLGDEWAPDTEDGEHTIVRKGFRDYFVAKGVTSIDPTIGLAIVLGSYALKRATRPKIQSKLSRGISWAKNLFSKR